MGVIYSGRPCTNDTHKIVLLTHSPCPCMRGLATERPKRPTRTAARRQKADADETNISERSNENDCQSLSS